MGTLLKVPPYSAGSISITRILLGRSNKLIFVWITTIYIKEVRISFLGMSL